MSIVNVRRNNLFYSSEEYELENDFIEEYIEEDLNTSIVLYEVLLGETNTDELYVTNKKNTIKYKTPKEIPCLYEIENSKMENYDKNNASGVYSIGGDLTIQVSVEILRKYEADIKRGDYVGILVDTNRLVYYTVYDDGKLNTSNKNYVGIYKPLWRIVKCSPVTEEEFKG